MNTTRYRFLLCLAACLAAFPARAQVAVAPDGWLRLPDGQAFLPLGGFHANVLPVSRLSLSPEELARVQPHIWSQQKTDGQGHVDLWDASDEMMSRWFRQLAADGVTSLRLFARARVGDDVLDLCGKLNPELQAVFHRAFAAARPYGIRFLLQILPEPNAMPYVNRNSIAKRVLPRYTKEELARLTPAQRRFMVEGKRITLRELFSDADALACQKQYLAEALDWVAREPQVFALEIYNEQGWTHMPIEGGKRDYTFTFPWEDDEIRWTAEIVRTIKQRLPKMPVTLSHPGFGVTGYDPLKWSKAAGVDFYSSHAYAGLSGENESIDFAAVTAATGAIIRAGIANFAGEWGVFSSPVPMELKRFSHRDAIWLSLMAGQPGFMQWTYEFQEEYRWPAKVLGALPKTFSPERPALEVEIGDAYPALHTNTRYSRYVPGKLFPAFPFNKEKQADTNLQKILAAYRRALELGVSVAFVMDSRRAVPLDAFLEMDAGKMTRPLCASRGYQLAYLKDARGACWIAYLRNRQVRTWGNHPVGVPGDPVRLEVAFRLPAGSYRVRCINLSRDQEESHSVRSGGTLRVADRTNDDYVLVVSPA